MKTVLYLRNLLKEMKFEQLEPTVIYIDNKSAKLLIETLKSTHTTKHINLRINFVSTEEQVADIFIKLLPRELLKNLNI